MEKYAFIPCDGKIVMVRAVDLVLSRSRIFFESAGRTASLSAAVTSGSALVRDIVWSSSDEKVATVGADGTVTAVGRGKAVVTATAVSSYQASASCHVTVGILLHRLTMRTENGRIACVPASPDGVFEEYEQIALRIEPDRGYQLKLDSFGACRTDNESVAVGIAGGTLVMPDYDVTVSAAFEPILYPIVCRLEGGSWREGEASPGAYTIESDGIRINNPVKDGCRFVGWTGTELEEPVSVLEIPAGSAGAREYTAIWKKEEGGRPSGTNLPEKPGKRESRTVKNPRTGNSIFWLYASAVMSASGILARTVPMVPLLGAFFFSVTAIWSYHRDAGENKRENEEVIRKTVRKLTKKNFSKSAGEPIDFGKLREINADTVGWIVFDGQRVNYPLVQADDNAYYLNHSFRGEENSAGCIFMDCRNRSFTDRNVVLYGHNMTDRTMFGSLKDVFREEFWEKEGRDIVWIADTQQHLRKYRIFSYYLVEEEDCYITTSFADDADYAGFLDVITARSFRELDVALTVKDRILTLSTCAGLSGTGRRVVHAKLIGVQTGDAAS